MDTSYQVEPELRTSVRQAFWTFEARITRKIAIGLVVAVLMIGGFFAYRDLSDLFALLQNGQEIAAQVTDKNEIHGKSTSYYLEYSFQSRGEWINDKAGVSRFLYETTPVGDTLKITYLPSAPSIHRVGRVDMRRVTQREVNWFLGIFGISAFFVLLLLATEYDYQRQMRLAVSGIPVVGKIISAEPPLSDSKTQSYTVKYSFVDLRGNTKTSGWSAPQECGQQLQPGQNVTVLCDPENPKRFCLYMGLDAAQVEGASLTAASSS